MLHMRSAPLHRWQGPSQWLPPITQDRPPYGAPPLSTLQAGVGWLKKSTFSDRTGLGWHGVTMGVHMNRRGGM